MKYIDLHLHSTYSDGTMTPTELVKEAVQRGVVALSVTDHDTTAGIFEAIHAGKTLGVEVISGVEISACLDDIPLHLLGYGFEPRASHLLAALEKVQLARVKRNRKILANLSRLGIAISAEELAHRSGGGQAGRPHIAALLVEKKWVSSMDEAFARFLRQGAAAYAEREILPVADAITMIRRAGGIAVLAHPLTIDRSMRTLPDVMKRLHDLGLGGAEAYYPVYSYNERTRIIQLCRELGLLVTGGSDYHGAIRSNTRLGGNNSRQRVPYELFEKLRMSLSPCET